MTNTSRRGFLGLLATVAAGAVLDPERLLWVPGAKTWFLPSVELSAASYGVELPRSVLIELVTRQMLADLERQLKFAERINHRYDEALDLTYTLGDGYQVHTRYPLHHR